MPKYYLRDYNFYLSADNDGTHGDISVKILAVQDNRTGSPMDGDFLDKLQSFLEAMNNRKLDKKEIQNVVAIPIPPKEDVVKEKITSALDRLEV